MNSLHHLISFKNFCLVQWLSKLSRLSNGLNSGSLHFILKRKLSVFFYKRPARGNNQQVNPKSHSGMTSCGVGTKGQLRDFFDEIPLIFMTSPERKVFRGWPRSPIYSQWSRKCITICKLPTNLVIRVSLFLSFSGGEEERLWERG